MKKIVSLIIALFISVVAFAERYQPYEGYKKGCHKEYIKEYTISVDSLYPYLKYYNDDMCVVDLIQYQSAETYANDLLELLKDESINNIPDLKNIWFRCDVGCEVPHTHIVYIAEIYIIEEKAKIIIYKYSKNNEVHHTSDEK